MTRTLLRNPWLWLGIGLLAVVIRGLFLDVMDVDAAQYASIAMEMGQRDSWLQVLHRGADYLDKPPLLFWTSAASMRLFGLHTWAYKLSSLLGALAGVYAVYRFAKLFYDHQTARHAAFILASSVGLLVICNDVRTDTLLLGMTACAVWQLAAYVRMDRWINLVGAALFVGLAMLAKGPIGLVLPAFAVGTHLLLRRDWRRLFHWPWLIGLGVVALVLAPMAWGLYQQYDLQPEKMVNERSGVSGIWFFFWEQSFGRITGGNVWKNDTSAAYFLHVYLWAFLPWPLLLAAGLQQRLREVIRQNFHLQDDTEAYSLGAFLLTFIALSWSQYKLPHYIFITLPWAAVLVARWLNLPLAEITQRRWINAHHLALAVMACAALLLVGFVFPTWNPLIWGPLLGIFGWLAFRIFQHPYPLYTADALVQRSILALLGAAFVLNFHFYPQLLPFQSTSMAAHWARQHGVAADRLAFFNRHGHALDFYSEQILPEMMTAEQIQGWTAANGALWIYTDQFGRDHLARAGLRYTEAVTFPHFQVALLRVAFLNPATRPQTLNPVYILKILPD